jgi:YVTN family beta-propeller protein
MRRRQAASNRHLATVLFTDLVASTERASDLGDRQWKDLLGQHNALVRGHLKRFGGRELDTAGDGFFQAIECACAVVDDVRGLGLEIKAGLHFGECEVVGEKLGGMAVHIGARVAARAGASQVWVTGTVRDLVVGGGVSFEPRGVQELKGVPGEWALYSVAWEHAAPAPLPAERQRRGWPVAAGVGTAVAIAVALLWLTLLRGGPPPAVPARADAVSRIDVDRNVFVQSVDTGRGPSGVVVGGGGVWVINQDATTLSRVDGAAGTSESVGVGLVPTGIAFGAGSVWISSGFGGPATQGGAAVLRYDAKTHSLQDNPIAVPSGAAGIAFGRDMIWVTNRNTDSVTQIDPQTKSVVGTFGVGGQPVAVAVDQAGRVWVADALPDHPAVSVIGTNGDVKTIDVADPPSAIAVGGGNVWAISTTSDRLIELGMDGSLKNSFPAGNGPVAVAVANNSVWVADSLSKEVLRIDPTTGAVGARLQTEGVPTGLAVDGGSVWVTASQP